MHSDKSELLQTPLHEHHLALQARMVDFGGWHMPVNFGSQIEEHLAVRQSAGIFDVSHMTVWEITGQDTIHFLRKLLANDIASVSDSPGKALYSCMLNPQGGVIDDLIVYYVSDTRCRMVTNAGTREKVAAWLAEQSTDFDVTVDERPDLALIAIQGPEAINRFSGIIDDDFAKALAQVKKFGSIEYGNWFTGRTGYTGEDGVEVILPDIEAPSLWQRLLDSGLQACGLGARDTLRLEAGLCLYGNDLDEDHTPLESGLLWTVSLKDPERDFIGRAALETQAQASTPRLIGLALENKGVLRSQQKVFNNEQEAGEITSGTWSPSLERSIAMARVQGNVGQTCSVEIRGKQVPATVVPVPFIKNGVSQLGGQS